MELTKHVVLVLRNGKEFKLKGESIEQVTTSNLVNHSWWFATTLANGLDIQIWAEDISVVYEEIE